MFLVDGGGNDGKGDEHHGIGEILVATGDDMQERKKFLIAGTDCIIVLPGGPGTWDELWEMACQVNLGMVHFPIVAVNVNGFYDGFKAMLMKAHEDELMRLHPDDIVHFEPTSEAAVNWVEKKVVSAKREAAKKGVEYNPTKKTIERRNSAIGTGNARNAKVVKPSNSREIGEVHMKTGKAPGSAAAQLVTGTIVGASLVLAASFFSK